MCGRLSTLVAFKPERDVFDRNKGQERVGGPRPSVHAIVKPCVFVHLKVKISKSSARGCLPPSHHLRRAARAARGARGTRAARMVALQLAPPSPIAARAERADAPAPAAARAPMMMRGLGPFIQVFGSHVAISGLAILA